VNEAIKLVNEHSKLVLEVEGEATTEGTRIEQYTDTGRDHQRWRLKPAGPGNEGFYNIENVRSGLSMEVVGYSSEPGAEIVQRSYESGPLHRQWKLIPVAGKEDVYKIENRHSGLVLDDSYGQTDAPAPVGQYRSWDDDGRQQWKLLTGRVTPAIRGTGYSWGYNVLGQLGGPSPQSRPHSPTPVQILHLPAKIIDLVAGSFHSLALLENGDVYGWGHNGYGQLGRAVESPNFSPTAQKVENLPKKAKAIAGGGYNEAGHSLALLEDGTIYAWGYNHVGQLGQDDIQPTYSTTPLKVKLPSDANVTAIAGGPWHNLALLEDGTVYAWGYNNVAQLAASPQLQYSATPRKVPSLPSGVKIIDAGGWGDWSHSLALLDNGKVYGWGYNGYGQLAREVSGLNYFDTPVELSDLPHPNDVQVKTIVAGDFHSLALMENGTVYAWGYNNVGQVGKPPETQPGYFSRPQKVENLHGADGKDGKVAVVAAGYSYNLAALDDGTVYCWGYETTQGSTKGAASMEWVSHSHVPKQVQGLEGIKNLAAGTWHCLASD
jgi:alpha-tubulin suppressor-like RCC1 family protein